MILLNKKLTGIMLLIIAFALYIVIGTVLNPYKDVYDDMNSWEHINIINSLKTGIQRFSSPYYTIDLIVATTDIPTSLLTTLFGMIYVFMVFYATYRITNNVFIAGFASLLFATTPSFIYWFKYNNYGAYLLQPLILIALILYATGVLRRKLPLLFSSVILASMLWYMMPEAWVLVLSLTLHLLAMIYGGRVYREVLLSLFILLLLVTPSILFGYMHPLRFFTYTLLVVSIILAGLVVIINVERISFNALKFLAVISAIPLAIYILSISGMDLTQLATETYSKTYNPLLDYGVFSLLSLFGLIAIIRSKELRSVVARVYEYLSIPIFLICIIFSFIIPTLSVIAVAVISPFVALGLFSVVKTLSSYRSGHIKYLYLCVALWIVIGSIVANAIPSYALSTITPQVFHVDLPRDIAMKYRINESSLLKILDYIKGNDTGKALIIGYWGHSYWISGYLRGVESLATPDSPDEYKRAVALIFMSDEDVSYGLIKRFMKNYTAVYVVVSEIISVDLTSVTKKRAYIGAAFIIPPETPGGMSVASFQAFGDIGRVFTYLRESDYNISDYVDLSRVKYYHEVQLGWKGKMLSTTLVKLVVYGLNQLGYDVLNSVYSELPLRVESPRHFRLVNATVIPIYTVSRDIYRYDVCVYTAIYRVKL